MASHSIIDSNELAKRLHKDRENGPLTLAGVPMRKNNVQRHTLICGATGTGKSVAIKEQLVGIRAIQKRAIVYDPSGEYIAAFYRPGRDIILNPFDERSPNWKPWNEVRDVWDYAAMAEGVLPDIPGASDPFWTQAGRILFEDLMQRLAESGSASNTELFRNIAISSLEELHKKLIGTAGAALVDPAADRAAHSVKMTVINALKSFRFLAEDPSKEAFSIRDWMAREDDSWLFVGVPEVQLAAMKPFISLWIDVAIRAVLTLPLTHEQRLWLVIDGLESINRVANLETVLVKARKFGLLGVLGIQSYSQLREIYGGEVARIITDYCSTWLVMRVDGASTLELAKRSKKLAVMGAEIAALNDLEGFLNILGDYPIARVKLQVRNLPKIAEAYMPCKSKLVIDDEPDSIH